MTSKTINEAHSRMRKFAAELVGEGFEASDIVDALVVVGLNASARAIGVDPTAAKMARMSEVLRETGRVGRSN